MHALKWWKESTRMFFDGDGGGSASTSPGAASGGDGGGAVSAPAPAGGSDAPAPDTSSPSASPPAPDASPPPPTQPEADPWASLGSLEDLDFIAQQPVPPTPAKPVVPPVVPPAATPPATPSVATPPAPPVVPAPAQPGVEGQPSPPPLSPSDPVGIANAIEANRDVVMAHLAQTKFALSEEDVKELETDVVQAVPKIMSRVFIEAQMSMQKFLAQALPGMMKQYGTVTKANDEAEQAFFNTHKELDIKNAQHRATAVRIASIYRQSNPTIPLEQLISEVGPMVKMALQINGTTPPAAASAVPGQPKGGTPFRPAVNGGGGSSPAPAEENPWAGLGQTFDEG